MRAAAGIRTHHSALARQVVMLLALIVILGPMNLWAMPAKASESWEYFNGTLEQLESRNDGLTAYKYGASVDLHASALDAVMLRMRAEFHDHTGKLKHRAQAAYGVEMLYPNQVGRNSCRWTTADGTLISGEAHLSCISYRYASGESASGPTKSRYDYFYGTNRAIPPPSSDVIMYRDFADGPKYKFNHSSDMTVNFKYGGRAERQADSSAASVVELRENATTFFGGQLIFRAVGTGVEVSMDHPNVVGRAGCYYQAPDWWNHSMAMECAYYRSNS